MCGDPSAYCDLPTDVDYGWLQSKVALDRVA
jgi:hypothetical protein